MRSLFGSGAFRRSARGGGGRSSTSSDLFGGLSGAGSGAGDRGSAARASPTSSARSSPAAAPRGAGRRGPQRGRDVEAEVTLDFADAVHGHHPAADAAGAGRLRHLPRQRRQARARSRGPARMCHGAGLVTRNQGSFSFSEPCRECQGVGTIVDEKCPECRGTGGVTKTRTLNVRVPGRGRRRPADPAGRPGRAGRARRAGRRPVRAGQGAAGRALRPRRATTSR